MATTMLPSIQRSFCECTAGGSHLQNKKILGLFRLEGLCSGASTAPGVFAFVRIQSTAYSHVERQMANGRGSLSDLTNLGPIYRFNKETKLFTWFQNIPTDGARGGHFFEKDGELWLAVANFGDINTGKSPTNRNKNKQKK